MVGARNDFKLASLGDSDVISTLGVGSAGGDSLALRLLRDPQLFA